MDAAFDATAAVLAFADLPDGQCPDGIIATGVATLVSTDRLEAGVWEHPVGRSTDVEQDEVFVVKIGRAHV